MVIPEVGPEHLANFTCAATNAHGRGEARFFVTGEARTRQLQLFNRCVYPKLVQEGSEEQRKNVVITK
jgi:hypothetical protein